MSDSESEVEFNPSDVIVLSDSESDSDCQVVEEKESPPSPPSIAGRTRASRRGGRVEYAKSDNESDTEEEKARIDALYKQFLNEVKNPEGDPNKKPAREKVHIISVERLIPKEDVPKEDVPKVEGTDQPQPAKYVPEKRRKLMIPTILRGLARKSRQPLPFGGLSSFLHNALGKKQKKSVLTKAQKEWKGFKEKEGIQEELVEHNKGKDGYLDKIDFLERTDYRQFEIEVGLRKTRSGMVRRNN